MNSAQMRAMASAIIREHFDTLMALGNARRQQRRPWAWLYSQAAVINTAAVDDIVALCEQYAAEGRQDG